MTEESPGNAPDTSNGTPDRDESGETMDRDESGETMDRDGSDERRDESGATEPQAQELDDANGIWGSESGVVSGSESDDPAVDPRGYAIAVGIMGFIAALAGGAIWFVWEEEEVGQLVTFLGLLVVFLSPLIRIGIERGYLEVPK